MQEIDLHHFMSDVFVSACVDSAIQNELKMKTGSVQMWTKNSVGLKN